MVRQQGSVTYEDVSRLYRLGMAGPINNRPGLVCVGFEKCGTTALDSILRDQGALCLPSGVKETRFFGGQYHRGREYYESLYQISEETRYFVDVSPAYIRSREAIQRIRNDCHPETRILVCLRNPVYRAFSHYVHDLLHHHSIFDPARYGTAEDRFSSPYSLSFFDEAEQSFQYHFTKYAPMLECLFDTFPPKKVLALILEKDFRDVVALSDRLNRFLGLDSLDLRPTRRENPMRFPRYVYHPEKTTEVSIGLKRVQIDAGKLAVIKGEEVIFLPVEEKPEVAEIFFAASRWTSRLAAADAERLFHQHFQEDVMRVEALLGRRLDVWTNFQDVSV